MVTHTHLKPCLIGKIDKLDISITTHVHSLNKAPYSPNSGISHVRAIYVHKNFTLHCISLIFYNTFSYIHTQLHSYMYIKTDMNTLLSTLI